MGEKELATITIKVTPATKKMLDALKLIPEEPYDKLLKRVLPKHKPK